MQPRPFARAVEEKRELKWQFPARDVLSLFLQVRVGQIVVIADSRDTVQIRATRLVRARKREVARALLEDSQVKVDLQDRRVTLEDVLPGAGADPKEMPEVELRLEVHVPPGISLRTSLDVGETRVVGETSLLTVKAGNGPVRLQRQKIRRSGAVAVDVGSVEIDGEVGDLAVSLGSGPIRGDRLTASAAETLIFQTQVGEVRVSLRSLPRRELRLLSGNGLVVARIPGNARAVATVLSATGKARSDFALPAASRAIGETGGTLAGNIGGGGTTIRVQTGVGDAALERD